MAEYFTGGKNADKRYAYNESSITTIDERGNEAWLDCKIPQEITIRFVWPKKHVACIKKYEKVQSTRIFIW